MLKHQGLRANLEPDAGIARFCVPIALIIPVESRCDVIPVPLAEEADQPFDVLCRCSQEELLPNELHSPQAQATQSDLILQLRGWRS